LSFILEGVFLGLSLAILLGPIFVVLIDTTLRYGARAGLVVGSGIWISDILFIIAMFGFIHRLNPLSLDASFQLWVGIAGGILLILTGLFKIFKNKRQSWIAEAGKFTRNLGFFGKGFVVNTFNPFTFVFWFGVMGSRLVGTADMDTGVLITCLSILFVIVFTDTAKVLGARWISGRINPSLVYKINFVAGLLLIAGGSMLIWKAFA
jgi:threonine/homoserine/homoserine lactone efflux protein